MRYEQVLLDCFFEAQQEMCRQARICPSYSYTLSFLFVLLRQSLHTQNPVI
jgi:hypothetical protein